ncbi:MAG: rRNA maturation RNase YbeY [Bacteroidia bacterium]|nr:MAG: rRNA maturation RNase YbeY [Bacteroidia bacterium]
MRIEFHYDISGFRIRESRRIKRTIARIINDAGRRGGSVAIIFTTDGKLVEINKEFLKHDYLTDIITFDYCKGKTVNGEIYISVDRIKENAVLLNTTLKSETRRVIFHGFLHLCGYSDAEEKERIIMRDREDMYLALTEVE